LSLAEKRLRLVIYDLPGSSEGVKQQPNPRLQVTRMKPRT
jgi:hypothetical protein